MRRNNGRTVSPGLLRRGFMTQRADKTGRIARVEGQQFETTWQMIDIGGGMYVLQSLT